DTPRSPFNVSIPPRRLATLSRATCGGGCASASAASCARPCACPTRDAGCPCAASWKERPYGPLPTVESRNVGNGHYRGRRRHGNPWRAHSLFFFFRAAFSTLTARTVSLSSFFSVVMVTFWSALRPPRLPSTAILGPGWPFLPLPRV